MNKIYNTAAFGQVELTTASCGLERLLLNRFAANLKSKPYARPKRSLLILDHAYCNKHVTNYKSAT